MKPFDKRPLRRGVGLTEILIATVIVGMLMVASLEALGMVARTQRVNSDRLTGPGLARDLLAEILALPYTDPQNPGGSIGVDAGETSGTRSTFDDVDDYHGWTSSNGVARNGTARSGYTGWSLAVTVTWAERATAMAWSMYDTNLKRVTVTVTSPTGVVTQLIGLHALQGALEQTLPVAGTAVGWVGVELRTGSSTRAQFTAAPLNNNVTDVN